MGDEGHIHIRSFQQVFHQPHIVFHHGPGPSLMADNQGADVDADHVPFLPALRQRPLLHRKGKRRVRVQHRAGAPAFQQGVAGQGFPRHNQVKGPEVLQHPPFHILPFQGTPPQDGGHAGAAQQVVLQIDMHGLPVAVIVPAAAQGQVRTLLHDAAEREPVKGVTDAQHAPPQPRARIPGGAPPDGPLFRQHPHHLFQPITPVFPARGGE